MNKREMVRTHEACGVGGIGPDLSIDLDQTLHNNRENLLAGQRIFQTVAEKDCERQRFSQFVRTRRWAGSLADVASSICMSNTKKYGKRT